MMVHVTNLTPPGSEWQPYAAEERDTTRGQYDELRKRRLDEFMTGFNIISLRLKEMYQMITLGGDAELELVDSLDPFSEGRAGYHFFHSSPSFVYLTQTHTLFTTLFCTVKDRSTDDSHYSPCNRSDTPPGSDNQNTVQLMTVITGAGAIIRKFSIRKWSGPCLLLT
jgi:hypothetical protein